MRVQRLLGIVTMIVSISQAMAQKHGFDVRDGIEMTTFSEPSALDPLANAKMSPDRRYSVVVTSNGLIKPDQVRSCLWLFDTDDIRRFLNEIVPRSRKPDPKLLAKVSAVPVVDSYIPYAPVISDVRWTADSRSIYFLGLDPRGLRELRRVDVGSGAVRTLTPQGYNVERYSLLNDVVVFTATRRGQDREQDEQDGIGGAIPVTGQFIDTILFPRGDIKPQIHELWFIRSGHAHRVENSPSRSVQPDLAHFWDVLSISPDGHSVVQINPIDSIHESWDAYVPKTGKEDWRIDHTSPKTTFPSNIFRARQYTLTDLRTGRSRPLINAPYGDVLAYIESFQAVWSRNGKRILLTNTFLPLDDVDSAEHSRRLHPCAVANVDIESRKTQCVVFTRESSVKTSNDPNAVKLENASFGSSQDEVVLRFRVQHDQTIRTERYQYSDGTWKLTETAPDETEHRGLAGIEGVTPDTLSIRVRQDLNDPPVLWATDPVTRNSKELWDPNPQLASVKFGEASVYHWKDQTGFEWTGGLVKPVDYVPGRQYPLVIQTHGFVDHMFMTDGIFPTAMAARPLASQGIAVLQVLGNSQHIGTLQEATDNVMGYESAINHLISDGLVDPKRVGIIGFSRTCWYVESALIEKPTLFAAASINDGVDESYMQAMLFDPDRTSEGQEIYRAKPFGEGLQEWVRLAPGFHLDRVLAPVIITAIKPVGVLEEWEIYSSLYQQGKPVDFLYIANGQHILQKPSDRLASQQGSVDWFRFWLQNYERPDPGDPTQYLRWRRLRARLHDREGRQ
jgi:hypothetical protein